MIVQGFWIGAVLSTMEKLCIKSFLANGHEFHLYTYDDILGIPTGTIIRDGRDIMPDLRNWCSPEYGEYHWGSWNVKTVGFSDFFRTELLLKNGGWYVDMDMVCLKPFDFQEEYVFAAEDIAWEPLSKGGSRKWRVNTNVIKVPPNSPVMQTMKGKFDNFTKWPAIAPELMTPIVYDLNLGGSIKSPSVFNPLSHYVVDKFITQKCDYGDAYSLHWWHGAWQQKGYNVDAEYPKDCLYERMKQKYL